MFAEVGDIILSDVLWGGASLDGIVLSGEAESVVTEGPENIKALLTVKSSEDVDDGKVADVADVEAGAGRVGEHFGEEHFGLTGFFDCFVGLLGFPSCLPF